MKPLSCKIDKNGTKLEIEISGSFTEESHFPEVSGILEGVSSIRFNLGGIDYINSLGILSWLAFIQKFEGLPDSVELSFHECPEVFVIQLNSIRGFIPEKARVESVYIPFYCESCEKRQDVLIKNGVEFSVDLGTYKLPQVACDCEGSEVEPDVLESNYFNFLTKKAA